MTVVPRASYSDIPCMSSPTPWSSRAPCSSIAYQPITSKTSCSLTAHSLRGCSPNHTNSNHDIPQFPLIFLIFFCTTPVLPDVLWTTPQDLQLSSTHPQTCSTDPQFPPATASWTGNHMCYDSFCSICIDSDWCLPVGKPKQQPTYGVNTAAFTSWQALLWDNLLPSS